MPSIRVAILLTFTCLAGICYGQPANNMTLLDNWNPSDLGSVGGVKYNDVWGYVDAEGGEYAIVGSANFIHIVDVSDPNNVVEIERITGGQGTIWRDFKTYHDRVYAVSDNTSEGLIIINVSQLPDTAFVTYQSQEFFSKCHNIFIDEDHGRLYVAGSNTRRNGLIVLGISSDPDTPFLITSDDLAGQYIHDLYVRDHIVYASHGFNGLYVYDYTAPLSINVLANITTNGYNHSSWLSDDCRYIYYAEEVPSGVDMGVIDAANLLGGEIELAHLFKFPLLAPQHQNVTPHNPYIRDTLLIVSYYEDGTQVFDIGQPLSPTPYAYYDTHPNSFYRGTDGNWGTYPFLPSGNIISTDIDNGLFVLQIDDYDLGSINYSPEFPAVNVSIAGEVDVCASDPVSLSASGNYAFYQWLRNGEQIPNQTSSQILIMESGSYQAVGLQGQCTITSEPLELTIAEPITPTLVNNRTTLDASPTSGSYRWKFGDIYQDQFDTPSISPSFSGYFQAERTDENGCIRSSDSVYYFVPDAKKLSSLRGLNVVHNAGADLIEITLETEGSVEYNLHIYDVIGRSQYQENLRFSGFMTYTISSSFLSTGIYFVSVDDGKELDSFKIFIP